MTNAAESREQLTTMIDWSAICLLALVRCCRDLAGLIGSPRWRLSCARTEISVENNIIHFGTLFTKILDSGSQLTHFLILWKTSVFQ